MCPASGTTWSTENVPDNGDRTDADQQYVRAQCPEIIATQCDDPRRIGFMPNSECHRDDGPAGIADNDRARDAELPKCVVEQVGLLVDGPDAAAWTLAMPESRPVEDDHPVASLQDLCNAARVVVIPGDHVALNENDGAAFAAIGVVQPDAVDLQERTLGRVLTRGAASQEIVRHRQGARSDCADRRRHAEATAVQDGKRGLMLSFRCAQAGEWLKLRSARLCCSAPQRRYTEQGSPGTRRWEDLVSSPAIAEAR